jgi:hypothetical protein
MKTLHISAKTWFDKINGNSYFSAVITIDYDKTINLPFQYGYGNQYLTEAKNVLTEHNYISPSYPDSLRTYCNKNGIVLTHWNKENCLKKELK